MVPQMQNPGLAPRASRDCFGGRSQPLRTAAECRAQMLASRFCLSLCMARDVAQLCFGESHND
jgi:hypothetical protein